MSQAPGPYPVGPYPAGPWPPPPRPYDERSVASLLLVGTVVAAPVSVWLGIQGIRNTRDGRRRGRWCAVSGVVGGLGVIAVLALAFLVRGPVARLIDPVAEVATGDCVDVRTDAVTRQAFLTEQRCSDPHDAEVVHRGRLDVFQAIDFLDLSAAELCREELDGSYLDEMNTGNYSMSVIVLGESADPEDGDDFLCLAGAADGVPLDGTIGASA